MSSWFAPVVSDVLNPGATINGVLFDGTSNITVLDGTKVSLTGNETIAGTKNFSSTITGSVTGNAGTATTLQNPPTINGVSFPGNTNITVADSTKVSLTGNETIAGTKTFSSTITGSISGNAGTATALQNPPTINGVSFPGNTNITVADSTKVALTGDESITGIKSFGSIINANSGIGTSSGDLALSPAGSYVTLATGRTLKADSIQTTTAATNLTITPTGSLVALPSGKYLYTGTTTQPTKVTNVNIANSTSGQHGISLTGQGFGNTATSTDGIGISLGYNATNNRHLYIADTSLATDATNAMMNVVIAGTSARLESIATNTSGFKPLELNGSTITLNAVPSLPSQTANAVFAAPNGSSGTPSFRALAYPDMPSQPFTMFKSVNTQLNVTNAAPTIILFGGGTIETQNATVTHNAGTFTFSSAGVYAIIATARWDFDAGGTFDDGGYMYAEHNNGTTTLTIFGSESRRRITASNDVVHGHVFGIIKATLSSTVIFKTWSYSSGTVVPIFLGQQFALSTATFYKLC